jgi:hypothetical protein
LEYEIELAHWALQLHGNGPLRCHSSAMVHKTNHTSTNLKTGLGDPCLSIYRRRHTSSISFRVVPDHSGSIFADFNTKFDEVLSENVRLPVCRQSAEAVGMMRDANLGPSHSIVGSPPTWQNSNLQCAEGSGIGTSLYKRPFESIESRRDIFIGLCWPIELIPNIGRTIKTIEPSQQHLKPTTSVAKILPNSEQPVVFV